MVQGLLLKVRYRIKIKVNELLLSLTNCYDKYHKLCAKTRCKQYFDFNSYHNNILGLLGKSHFVAS